MASDWKDQLREIARIALVRKLASERIKELYRGLNEHQPIQSETDGDREHSNHQDVGEARAIREARQGHGSTWRRNNDPFVVEHPDRVPGHHANGVG